jgi:hypothetical protein
MWSFIYRNYDKRARGRRRNTACYTSQKLPWHMLCHGDVVSRYYKCQIERNLKQMTDWGRPLDDTLMLLDMNGISLPMHVHGSSHTSRALCYIYRYRKVLISYSDSKCQGMSVAPYLPRVDLSPHSPLLQPDTA